MWHGVLFTLGLSPSVGMPDVGGLTADLIQAAKEGMGWQWDKGGETRGRGS